ncbi:MAG: ankyrin repeat domain-containing protein [Acidobacteria bacterium]|nr:ankyrin repeat domain-containing protein [Acidobacteriota bacterium]
MEATHQSKQSRVALAVWGMVFGIGSGVLCFVVAIIGIMHFNAPNGGSDKREILSYCIVGVVFSALGIISLWFYLRARPRSTPLMRALKKSASYEIVIARINTDANVNTKDEDGITPLMMALINGANSSVVRALIKAGANVNEKSSDGYTPLTIAYCKYAKPEVVTALINAGAKESKDLARDEAKKSGDWATLLKMLAECQSIQEMDDLSLSIACIGNKAAASGLVALAIQSHVNGCKAREKLNELRCDPQALLMDRLRQQTSIFTIGYNPQSVCSPIREQEDVMARHFKRESKALAALVGLKAIEEIQAVLDNPAYEKHVDNFRYALGQIYEKERAEREINSSTPNSIDENKYSEEQTASVGTSEAAEGRDVTFVIPCGVCGYKTDVTVTIDWGGCILSGNTDDHEFRCHNCNKVFTVSKAYLKHHTDCFV